MSFKLLPTIASAIMMKGKYGTIAKYGVNTLSAHHIDKHVAKPDTLLENGLQYVSPAHYIAYKVAKKVGAGPMGYVLATIIPNRYAAYHLSKLSGGKLTFLEKIGIVFAPTATVAFNAAKEEVLGVFGNKNHQNIDGDTYTSTQASAHKANNSHEKGIEGLLAKLNILDKLGLNTENRNALSYNLN